MSQFQYELSCLIEEYGVRGLSDQIAQVLRQRAAVGESFPYDPVRFRDTPPLVGNDLLDAANHFEADF